MYNKYYTVSIIGLEPTRPGYTLWFGLVRTVHHSARQFHKAIKVYNKIIKIKSLDTRLPLLFLTYMKP